MVNSSVEAEKFESQIANLLWFVLTFSSECWIEIGTKERRSGVTAMFGAAVIDAPRPAGTVRTVGEEIDAVGDAREKDCGSETLQRRILSTIVRNC